MLHPAEHRVLRELYAFTRQLARHWSHLGDRLGGPEGELLRAGAAEAEEVLGELEAAASRQGARRQAGRAACSAGWSAPARRHRT